MSDALRLLQRANPLDEGELSEPRDEALEACLAGVLARPAATPRRRLHVLRGGVLLAAGLVAVGAPIAASGVGERLVRAVTGAPPPRVRGDFNRMLLPPVPPDEGPAFSPSRRDLIRSSERRVLATRTLAGQPLAMYVARLRRRGSCLIVRGGSYGAGMCGPPVKPLWSMYGTLRQDPREIGRIAHGLWTAGRVTAPGASSFRVEYRDGDSTTVPLQDGWFFYEVPDAHALWTHQPDRFVLLAADGRELGRIEDPFRLRRRPQGPPRRPQPATIRLVVDQPLPSPARGRVRLWLARDQHGSRCLRVLNTIDRIQTGHWRCGFGLERGPDGPLHWELGVRSRFGHPGGWVYAYGWLGGGLRSAELRFEDSRVERLPLHDGVFLTVIPPASYLRGHRPSYLVGRDAAGVPRARRFLYPHQRCTYPVEDARCRETIVATG